VKNVQKSADIEQNSALSYTDEVTPLPPRQALAEALQTQRRSKIRLEGNRNGSID